MKDNTEKNLVRLVAKELRVPKADITIHMYSFSNSDISINYSYRNWSDEDGSYELVDGEISIKLYQILQHILRKL